MQAVYIKANGETTNVEPKDSKHFTLKELQSYVGGYIEMITLDDGRKMINE